MIRYCPDPSVTAERTFSIRAELLASTVTPGNTLPDGSRTTPANVVCACAKAGRTRNARRSNERDIDLTETPLPHESASRGARTSMRHRRTGTSYTRAMHPLYGAMLLFVVGLSIGQAQQPRRCPLRHEQEGQWHRSGRLIAAALYLTNRNSATWSVPSSNLMCSWRHEPAHALSVFQTNQ